MNSINWFEIPAADFESAVRFYETIFDTTLRRGEIAGQPQGFINIGEDIVGGAIVYGNGLPSSSGSLVYLNASNEAKLDAILDRVRTAGGEVLTPKTSIAPQGLMAIFRDSEGNRVGLHVPPAA
jgi:predicted enzyme related to lactoylglutathione lyase